MKNILLGVALCAAVAHSAWAQSFCTSEDQAAPLSLVERFVSADCAACWSAAPTTKPGPRALTIDWVVPGGQGDDAALSAAAIREAQMRLDTVGRARPATATVTTSKVLGHPADQLQVTHGVTVGAYIGAIIEFKTSVQVRPEKPLSVWLLLVETLAAGVEGTQVERNLVRNVLVSTWDSPGERSETGHYVFRELRPLNIPQGARPERLRLVGWVQDARGQVLSAAQSVCATAIDAH